MKKTVLLPFLVIGVLVAGSAPGHAQENAASKPEKAAAPLPEAEAFVATGLGTRFLSESTPLVNEKGVFEAAFTHRFYQPVIEAGGGNALGLDGGSAIGLGMDYVPVKNVAIQIFRSSLQADYEFALKATALRPRSSLPIAIGARAGINWLTASYIEKKTAAFGQLLVSCTIADRVTLAASPTYVSKTPFSDEHVVNVPVSVQIRITSSMAAIGEFVPKKSIGPDSVSQWAFGLSKNVFHHRFDLWIGNSGATSVDQIMRGDYLSGVVDSNIRLGFNIIRQFDIAND